MKVKFTKKNIEAIEATDKRQTIFDTAYPGLAMLVTPAGAKTFYYTYRMTKGRGAQMQWLKIGKYPAISPEVALDKAKAAAALVQNGVDPTEGARKEKIALSVADALDEFKKEHVDKLKPRSIEFYDMIIRVHLKPAFGKTKVKSLGYSEVARFHTKMEMTPYVANRCIAVLSVFLNWCELHGHREKNTNPCQKIKLFTEEKRKIFMGATELSILGDALARMETTWHARQGGDGVRAPHDKEGHTITPQVAAAIRLLMFTGARRGEILSLKWSYIDMQRGTAALPDSKTGFKVLQLPAPALV